MMKKCQCLLIVFLMSLIVSLMASASDQPIMVLDNGEAITAIAFSPDGSKLLVGRGKCFIWDLASGKKILTINSSAATCVAFSPDGKMAATGTDPLFSAIWNAETGEKIQDFHVSHPMSTPEVISAIAFHLYDPYVITGTSDGAISKWDIHTGKETPLMDLGSTIDKIHVFSDGDRIAVHKYIISLKTNSILQEFVSRVHISGDEKYIYCRSGEINEVYNGKQVVVYDAKDYHLVKKYPVFISSSSDALFSPDGSLVLLSYFVDASGNYDSTKLQLMRVETNEIVHEFKVKGKENMVINEITFSPDGKRVAIVGNRNNIYIWDISDLYSAVPQSTDLKQ